MFWKHGNEVDRVRAGDGTHSGNRFAPARISLLLDRDHAAPAMSPAADETAMGNAEPRPILDAMDG
jgi:hypothetical protein